MSVAAPPSPFKGLAAFEDTDLDALFFCGREREREVAVANLLASRLTVLYGASGVGKTSLLRAAVAHSLRTDHHATVVLFSSWAGDPRLGLAEAIDEAAGIEAEGALADRLRAAGEVFVILDQFEEYFLYHDGGPFAAELAEAIGEPGLRANFLLGLREDALAKLDAFKGQIPNLFANYLRLDHLSREGARAAILGPVERHNELTGESVRVEPELVDAVLNEVAAGRVDVGRAARGGVETDSDRIEAPYLQLVLERLWEAERERGSTVIRVSTLRELGGAEAIVRAHLERALDRLEPAGQDVAASMFGHLVTPSGTKIAHRPGDLAQYAAVPEAEVQPVLDTLGKERIVRAVDGAGGAERYEIFHDVLADGVLAWRTRRELERDRERARAHQRRLTVVAVGALLGLAAMTLVAIYAFTERSHARSSARQARARALEATSLAELPQDPQRALRDALSAAHVSRSGHAASVLRQALVATHIRHVSRVGGTVSTVAFSPRGGRMLAAGSEGRVYVYSRDGTVQRALKLGAPVRAASFSPDGRVLAVTSGRNVGLWNPATGKRRRALELPGVAIATAFSSDGRLLLGTSPRGATVWRTDSGRQVAAFHPSGGVQAGAISPNGRLVALIVANGKDPAQAFVYDVRKHRRLHVLARRTGLRTVAFSPGGRLLATAAYQGIFLWDARGGRRVRSFVDSKKPVNDAEFSPDGSLLATAGEDGATRIWDVRRGGRLFYFADHTNPDVAVAWSPDGRFVADASPDRTSNVWMVVGTEEGKEVGKLVGHRAGVTSLAYAPDGRSVLTGGADGTARLWDATFEQHLQPLGSSLGEVATASFGDRGRLVVSADADGTARIWNVRGHRRLQVLRPGGIVNDARLSPDGRLVVTAGSTGAAVWVARTGDRLRTLQTEGRALVARFSPDGSLVVTGDANGGVRLWRKRDGELAWTRKQAGAVADAAFTSDGKRLVTAGSDGATIWSLAGKREHRLPSPEGVSRLALSSDGTLLATADLDGTARIWDAATGHAVHVLPAGQRPVTDVAFSPDGRLLVTTGPGLRGVQTWEVGTWRLRHQLVGQFGNVSAAAFSPDSHWLVTAGPFTAGLWQSDSDQPPVYLRGDTKPLTSVAFSPDGRLVLSSSKDGSVRLYRCEVCGNLKALVGLAERRLAAAR